MAHFYCANSHLCLYFAIENEKKNQKGGFGGNIGHDPHLLSTLSAIQVLLLLHGNLNHLNIEQKQKIIQFIVSLQKKDGSFVGDKWGEVLQKQTKKNKQKISLFLLVCLCIVAICIVFKKKKKNFFFDTDTPLNENDSEVRFFLY